ncbi:8901_t:CDS:2 [Diversispora eburnea]|uniref:8901_t:CDS:1 n=1 Tax=Diversispora eburnea TaxID=1213867 RepID=A0A9N9CRL6_9GLOM|nr:8901_t:CDS:2 [Diversispora eburnea]
MCFVYITNRNRNSEICVPNWNGNQNRTTNNVLQSSVSPTLSVTLQTPIPSSIIAHSGTDNNTNSVNLDSAEKVENILDNTSNHSATASDNSDIYQESDIQYSEPLIRTNPKSPEDKEIDDFQDRQKSIQSNSQLQVSNSSTSSHNKQSQNGISSKIVEASTSVLGTKCHFSEIKIPYNQKVEWGLRNEIFVYDKNNNNKIIAPCTQITSDNTFDIRIPEFSLEMILRDLIKLQLKI